jgi:hypothetical protein
LRKFWIIGLVAMVILLSPIFYYILLNLFLPDIPVIEKTVTDKGGSYVNRSIVYQGKYYTMVPGVEVDIEKLSKKIGKTKYEYVYEIEGLSTKKWLATQDLAHDPVTVYKSNPQKTEPLHIDLNDFAPNRAEIIQSPPNQKIMKTIQDPQTIQEIIQAMKGKPTRISTPLLPPGKKPDYQLYYLHLYSKKEPPLYYFLYYREKNGKYYIELDNGNAYPLQKSLIR